MLEAAYQKKIMKDIEADGGHVVNGTYSKAGEADLQAGIPVIVKEYIEADKLYTTPRFQKKKILIHCAIEVKTEKDYHRVMRAIDDDYNIINSKPLKSHETLQLTKIRLLRAKGGLALVAYNYGQVLEYIGGEI